MFRFCHRCQSELPPHEEGTLFFCSHCGAAQLLLSEELQTQVETLTAAEDASAHAAPQLDLRATIWIGAIRCAALAGAVAAGLSLISTAVPVVVLFAMLWAVISPVVVIGLFQSRFPLLPITASFGARLGLVTGLMVATAMATVNTATLLVLRYRLHAMSDTDQAMTANIAQMRAQIAAQPDARLVSLFNSISSTPEFRAGLLLVSLAMLTAILLALTTAGGAFAGFIRSRARA